MSNPKYDGGCKHCCKQLRPGTHRRGLCEKCYRDPEIVCFYPKIVGTFYSIPQVRCRAKLKPDEVGDNMSIENLDKMIAEQMLCLPDWWQDDVLEEGRPSSHHQEASLHPRDVPIRIRTFRRIFKKTIRG